MRCPGGAVYRRAGNSVDYADLSHRGTASRAVEQSTLECKGAGIVRFANLRTVKTAKGDYVVMNRNGVISIMDEKGRKKESYPAVYGAHLKIEDSATVKAGQVLMEWDPFTSAILAEHGGLVHFRDVVDGVTIREEVDEVTGLSQRVVVEHGREDLQPRISIKDEQGATVFRCLLPVSAHLMVSEGQMVSAGDSISKIPRETMKTKDITGGLREWLSYLRRVGPRMRRSSLRSTVA